ncbi:hypothetical protein, partial [Acinetobacter baumannii]|uniref:hypothetical protein n=1 Tax=Acinetobacter baumannii TaxID=470 RepID=UPI001C0A427D
RLEHAGIEAREIRAALNTDKTELSRYRTVCRVFPVDLIETIGRCPAVGRNRWLQVADEYGAATGDFE